MNDIITGLSVPFLGTSLGAACVFLMKNEMNKTMQRILTGFAAGVMTAASVWSLLIPAIEQNEDSMGRLAFIPAAVGFLVGIFFFCCLTDLSPTCTLIRTKPRGSKPTCQKTPCSCLR